MTDWLTCRHCGVGPKWLRWPNGRLDWLPTEPHKEGCPLRVTSARWSDEEGEMGTGTAQASSETVKGR